MEDAAYHHLDEASVGIHLYPDWPQAERALRGEALRVLPIIQEEGVSDAIAHGRDGLSAKGWTPLATLDFDVATSKTRTVLYVDAVRAAGADPGVIQRRIDDEADRPLPDDRAGVDPQATPGAQGPELRGNPRATQRQLRSRRPLRPLNHPSRRTMPWAIRRWRSRFRDPQGRPMRARRRHRLRRHFDPRGPCWHKRRSALHPLAPSSAKARPCCGWMLHSAQDRQYVIMGALLLAYVVDPAMSGQRDAAFRPRDIAWWIILSNDTAHSNSDGSRHECRSKTYQSESLGRVVPSCGTSFRSAGRADETGPPRSASHPMHFAASCMSALMLVSLRLGQCDMCAT